MGWFFLTQSLSTSARRHLVYFARDQLSQDQPDHGFVILWMTMPYRLSQSRSWLAGGVLLPTTAQNCAALQRCETVLRATMHPAHQLIIQSAPREAQRHPSGVLNAPLADRALGPREGQPPLFGRAVLLLHNRCHPAIPPMADLHHSDTGLSRPLSDVAQHKSGLEASLGHL